MNSIELFAGAGGLGIGVSMAGFEPKAVIERDKYCCDTIKENKSRRIVPIVHWPLIEKDVCTIDYSAYKNILLVSGGPPCQPFSIGGKHSGMNDKRDMFPEAVRAVRELRPKAFLFENVKGLTRDAFANYLEYIKLQLAHPLVIKKEDEKWQVHHARLEQHHTKSRTREMEYTVLQHLLNAADYGVPQRRERVFIVGFRKDLNVQWSFPEPTHSFEALLWDQWRTNKYWDRHEVEKGGRLDDPRMKARAKKLKERPELVAWRTVRDAIGDLPHPKEPEHGIANHQFQGGAKPYTGHTGSHWDLPAKTLKAGDHGVPGGENMLLNVNGSVRYFSVRESARLQTFPDSYHFHGTWTETMRQLGNAVPVRLANIVAQSIRNELVKAGG